MSNSDIFASRDALNKKLVETLSMYGNLEPPGVFGRPYNDGSNAKYPFSAANYLRMLAVQREKSYHDPRWISEAFVESNGISLKEGAVPVEVEYWKGINHGDSYTGELRKFYNVSEIDDAKVVLKEVTGNKEEDIEYAIDLLKDNDIHATYKFNIEQIFDAAVKFAKAKGADEFASTLTGQLLLKTSHLALDYTKHHLFTEEQLQRMEQNGKIIFAAIKKAQSIVNHLQYVHEQSLQKQLDAAMDIKRTIEHQREASRELFRGLKVDLAWSEADLKDLRGNLYRSGSKINPKNPDTMLHLTGIAAYEFLVQLNAKDKECFNQKLWAGESYAKTKIAFQYGKYNHGEFRIDLGDLELGNKTSIADALSVRLNSGLKELEQAVKSSPEGKGIRAVQQSMVLCNEELETFRLEENRYLAQHPALKKINEQKADTYLYCGKNEDIAKLPSDMVLATYRATEFPGMALCDNNHKTWSVDRNDVVVELAIPYHTNQEIEKLLHPAMTQKTQEANLALKNLSLAIHNYGTVFHPSDEPQVQSYRGAAAVEAYIKAMKADADLANEMCSHYKRDMMDEIGLSFSYAGHESKEIRYTNGSGVLARHKPIRRTDGLIPLQGYIGVEKDIDILNQSIYKTAKQTGHHNTIMNNLVNKFLTHPQISVEQRKESLYAEKPAARALNTKHYAYYQELAAQDAANDTPLKLMNSMVSEMKQDGLKPIKIANIVRTNPFFARSLTEQPESIPSSSKSPKDLLRERMEQKKVRSISLN